MSDRNLSAVERDVLDLCGVPRRSGDIAFLLQERGGDRAAATAALDALEQMQLISSDAHGLWRHTTVGEAIDRVAFAWEVEVVEVFDVSWRTRPLAMCTLRRGRFRVGDRFSRSGGQLGSVVSIDLPGRRLPGAAPAPAPSISICVDIDVAAGDVLTSAEEDRLESVDAAVGRMGDEASDNLDAASIAELARAMVAWTGFRRSMKPTPSEGRLIAELGEEAAIRLLPVLRSLRVEFYEEGSHRGYRRESGVDERSRWFWAKHPDLPEELIQALAWCYSYDYR